MRRMPITMPLTMGGDDPAWTKDRSSVSPLPDVSAEADIYTRYIASPENRRGGFAHECCTR